MQLLGFLILTASGVALGESYARCRAQGWVALEAINDYVTEIRRRIACFREPLGELFAMARENQILLCSGFASALCGNALPETRWRAAIACLPLSEDAATVFLRPAVSLGALDTSSQLEILDRAIADAKPLVEKEKRAALRSRRTGGALGGLAGAAAALLLL